MRRNKTIITQNLLPNNLKRAKGATLLEVLVSVFLLTFGVLGLMAAQLRSVSAVSETESQTYAAQAAENLSEAMQINPTITDGKRSYNDFLKETPQSVTSTLTKTGDSDKLPSSDSIANSTEISKSILANAQISDFAYILGKMPNAANVHYVICKDNSNPKAPISVSDANCVPANNDTDLVMIKIIWQSIATENTTTNEPVTYSYMLHVPK